MWKFYSADRRAMAQARTDIGPEFVPQVPGQTAEQAVRAAQRRLSRRRHARRQPGVFDDVVENVAGKSAPRRLELTVGTRREHDGLQRVRRSRPDAAARRADVSGIFSPQRAESGFDGVGNCDVSLAFEIPLAEAERRSRPLVRDAPARLPCRRDDTDGEAARAEHAFDDPVDALDAVDGCRRFLSVGLLDFEGFALRPTDAPAT